MFEQLKSFVWHLRVGLIHVMDSCTDLGSVFEFVTAFYIVFFVFFYEVRNHSPALVSEVALKWVTSSFNHQKICLEYLKSNSNITE